MLKNIKFQSVPGVKKCHILDMTKKKQAGFVLQLEGINFNEILKYFDLIDINKIDTNDLGSYLRIYGVK